MSGPSKIEWTDAVWNPVTGCTKVSPGCQSCYAERFAKRLAGRFGYPADEPFKVTLHPERLEEPLRWRKPRQVFVCSMGDLFHPDVPNEYLYKVFSVMSSSIHHTFLILTKRPERMKELISDYFTWRNPEGTEGIDVPNNIWLGVTAENQKTADERIPILLEIPAAVRFVSCEPLLGPVDFTRVIHDNISAIDALNGLHGWPVPHAEGPKLDWVICGGESGPGARPMRPDWVRSLRDQCQAAGVPFFFKQWGEWCPAGQEQMAYCCGDSEEVVFADPDQMFKVGKKKAGRLLDGRTWDEFPEVG